MAASASNPLGIRTENVDVVLGGDTVLVTLVYASSEQDLNSNNLAVDHPLYRVLELNSETPAPLPVYDKSKPMCELCLRTFSSFSEMCKHKGSLCVSDLVTSDSLRHPVRIVFHKTTLPYIKDGLDVLKKELHSYSGDEQYLFFVHEMELVPLLLRKLYTLQFTKYPSVTNIPPLSGIPITAPTIFLPLCDDELKVLRSLCSVKLAEAIGMPSRLRQAELDGLQNLEDKLGAVMQPGKQYFCRLSTRSPKDAVSLTEEEKTETDPSKRLLLKYRHLCVKDASYALELLSKSQRIFSDISYFFQHRISGTSSDRMSIILREWIGELPQDHEFRYHCYTVFPTLTEKLEHVAMIRDAILQFHTFLSPHIPFDDYVIDIVVMPGLQCQVIELNPFGPAMSSGSALFDWHRDLAVLLGDQPTKSIPIRILKSIVHEK